MMQKRLIGQAVYNVLYLNNALDGSKFGLKMLEKMGWSNGKGLGAQEQGMADPVKLKAQFTTKGVGCQNSVDDTWISHCEAFEGLLSSLNPMGNAGKDAATSSQQSFSLESKSKQSRSRVHYHKFTRGKDLSNYSKHDIDVIVGKKSRRSQQLANIDNDEIATLEPQILVNQEAKLTTNTCDMQAYFKSKLKQRVSPSQPTSAVNVNDTVAAVTPGDTEPEVRGGTLSNTEVEKPCLEETSEPKKKNRKRKREHLSTDA